MTTAVADQCPAIYHGQWQCHLDPGHDEAHEATIDPNTTVAWVD